MMEENPQLTDEEVVHKVWSEDQELYAIIVDRYQHKLMRYAINLIHDDQKARDIVQESLIKAFVNIRGFDPKKKFSSWIYRIVHNEAMDVIKKYHREVPFPEDFDIQSEENIEDDFDQKEVVSRVNLCLGKIPLKYSEPLTLYYVEEKSYKEISDILRIPMGTVATNVNRAKKMMKHICQKI